MKRTLSLLILLIASLGMRAQTAGGIINDYTPVLSMSTICKNLITVENAGAFKAGDTVLLIQMKGAAIDSNQVPTFGTVTDYRNAGNYQFNYVKSKTGNVIELLNVVTRPFTIPAGRVQLIRVPYYQNVSVTSTLTCLSWDGAKGGVLVFTVQDNLNLNADVDVSGRGFRGGQSPNSHTLAVTCSANQSYYAQGDVRAAARGESVVETGNDKKWGKAPGATGGGGGVDHNSGGGGGANGGAGGKGGFQVRGCVTPPFDNGGRGGIAFQMQASFNKILMGGGGGAGHANNLAGIDMNGGNGGGIVIVRTNKITANGHAIRANGNPGRYCDSVLFDCNDGNGGGGAGGHILIDNTNYVDFLEVNARGGKGADLTSFNLALLRDRLGPGGGGGGGLVSFTNASIPASVTPLASAITGGAGGTIISDGLNPWGTDPGQDGAFAQPVVVQVATTLFKPNIDSVRFNANMAACGSYDFQGLGYTNTNPVSTWQWFFGDATTANTQNATHTYVGPGTYTVKLVVTDINGCKDSLSKQIIFMPCTNAVGNIINTYTPVLSFDPCKNNLVVEDASTFNVGDTVLMIQMKGAIIDSTNTAAFGTITDYKNAGNYEFNYVKSVTGNVIELKNVLLRAYDIPVGRVQLIRVPYFEDAYITSTLTCPPWDGRKGGVLVLNVADSIDMYADIDISGKGFSKGTMINSNFMGFTCGVTDYYRPDNTRFAAGKGEGISFLSPARNSGKGPAANGGGGGMDTNSGGAGGSNGTNGGRGGYELNFGCPNYLTSMNFGFPGNNLTYSTVSNKIFMGGGGGAGHCNNQYEQPASIANFDGGNGGGLAIINANYIRSNSKKIISKGDKAFELNITNNYVTHDGMGGGGAGGTVLMNINNYVNSIPIDVSGGKGGDMVSMVAVTGFVGPGGGGSGGVIWVKQPGLPANLSPTNTGGLNGVITQGGNTPYGAAPGQVGLNVFNLTMPFTTVPFKPNIDSVRFNALRTGCPSYDFQGLSFTNFTAPVSWDWYFGDNTTAHTQNTSHTYTAAGTYTVKLVITDINGCKDSVMKDIVTGASPDFDFTYRPDVCNNPLSVQFTGIGSSTLLPYWSFGDATTVTGTTSPVHVYPSFGTYTVKYSISSGSCVDTVTKIITLSLIQDDIIRTLDTTICFGTTKQLLTKPSLSFCWSPVTYLDDPLSANPVTSTPTDITYYFTAEVPGTNVIVNGDFNAGNTGFTSAYVFANPNTTEGQYFVGTNSQAWNSSMNSCTAHGGSGNMMMVNGSPTLDLKVWTQTVTVVPNTNYAFSTWIQSLWPPNPAQLQFSINDNDLGPVIMPNATPCNWTQFYTTWNSGNNTSATISIVNKNTLIQGNDFALDDISFAPLLLKRDSVKISIDKPVINATNSTAICEGKSLQLDATGANTYSWTPSTGLSNTGIHNPVATPVAPIRYYVTGTTVNGCQAKDSLDVSINPNPVVTKSANDTICSPNSIQLLAGGGVSYSWTPAATLSSATAPNPVATPPANIRYYVTVTGANTCQSLDSIDITVRSPTGFSINPPVTACTNDKAQLFASGGDLYSWLPAGSLDNASIYNPMATAGSTTTFYAVTITDTLCGNVSTLTTSLVSLPLPNIKARRTNDIDCAVPQSNLVATGGIRYTWSPAATLHHPNNPSTVAIPTVTTLYTVIGTGNNGCVNTDTVSIIVKKINPTGYVMPTAFTPNNDGLNDCYGPKYWGSSDFFEFSIYNRWGNRVFYTTNPAVCWDGTYKGVPQDAAAFVYMVRAKTVCDGVIFRKGTFVLIR